MNKINEVYTNRPRNYKRNILIWGTVFLLVALSLPFTKYSGIKSNGITIILSILKGLINPKWSILLDFTKYGVPFLIVETVAIAFLGTFIGMVISIPFAFFSARNIVPPVISRLGILIINMIRTFPPFVFGLILIRISGPGAFTGVLTLAITSLGMISKMFIEIIEDLDEGILEALDATGCNTIQKIRHGVIPQLLGNFASISIYRFEINVKNASILGLVGAGGIGAPLLFAMGAYRWDDVGALLWGLIALVVVIEWLSTVLRRKLG